MVITNTSTGIVELSDLPGAQSGQALTIQPGQTVRVMNADAEQSAQLAIFLSAGTLVNMGPNEPTTGTLVGGAIAAGSAASITLGGDLSGAPATANVAKLKGIIAPVSAPTTGQALFATSATQLGYGALPVAGGGTGAITAGAARTALGAAASGANGDITSLTGLTTPLPLTEGGTGAITAGAARTSLGAAASGVNADITNLNGLTLTVYANNAAAVTGGLPVGALYRTGADPDLVAVVH